MIEWQKIVDIEIEAKQLTVLAQTIQDAMENGPSPASAYLDSLSILTNLMQAHARKLSLVVTSEIEKNSTD